MNLLKQTRKSANGLITGVTLFSSCISAKAQQAVIAIPSQEAVAAVPMVPQKYVVQWLRSKVLLDGNLDDWKNAGIQGVPLAGPEHVQWTRGTAGNNKDASTFYLARDAKGLYFAVDATSSRQPLPSRIDVSFDTLNDAKVITGWRDVGERYDSDDYHYVFSLNGDTAKVVNINDKLNIDSQTLRTIQTKVVSAAGRVVLEAFFPWKTLAPYISVSYQSMKFDVAVYEDGVDYAGVIGWTAGLADTYDAGHFGEIDFPPPPDAQGVEISGSINTPRFVDQEIPAVVTLYNHGSQINGATVTLAAQNSAAHKSTFVNMETGLNKVTLSLPSEQVGAGEHSFTLTLTRPGAADVTQRVQTSNVANTVQVTSLAQINVLLSTLKSQANTLKTLEKSAQQVGSGSAYPVAYRTLYEMFIDRCNADLQAKNPALVEANCERLTTLFPIVKSQIEKIIARPKSTFVTPPRFNPAQLTTQNGYYFSDGKPVFLWGPNMYWFVRQDLSRVRDLGFNYQSFAEPQFLGLGKGDTLQQATQYLADSQNWGIATDANIDFSVKYAFAKAHPEVANRDPNNFMPLVIQAPEVKQALADWFTGVVPFLQDAPAVKSYTLANEPWYLNYGELTRHDFIESYLKPRYKTIGTLNQRWKSQYTSFDEIQLIQWPDSKNYAPWYDFQQFRDLLLRDHFASLRDTVKQLDPNRPSGVKFMATSLPSFNMEMMEGLYDINDSDGNMNDANIIFYDFCHSLWPKKILTNTEVHISWTGVSAVESSVWRLALHGLSAGAWWGWHPNPRVADTLSNADSLYALSKAGLDVQRLAPEAYALNQQPSTIATLFPDVVERRSDLSMVRMRLEIAAAEYPLGIRPAYATEKRIAAGELSQYDLLVAGESDYITDATYKAILKWVSGGGKIIVLKGGMAHNEWGDARDTSTFIKPGYGARLADGATVYDYGKGQVVCVDGISALNDIVKDGGQVLQSSPDAENMQRREIYSHVLLATLQRYKLEQPVRLLPAAGNDPVKSTFGTLDWRAVQTGDGYLLCAVQSGAAGFTKIPCRLQTSTPVKSVTDLISGKQLDPTAMTIGPEPVLLRIER